MLGFTFILFQWRWSSRILHAKKDSAHLRRRCSGHHEQCHLPAPPQQPQPRTKRSPALSRAADQDLPRRHANVDGGGAGRGWLLVRERGRQGTQDTNKAERNATGTHTWDRVLAVLVPRVGGARRRPGGMATHGPSHGPHQSTLRKADALEVHDSTVC